MRLVNYFCCSVSKIKVLYLPNYKMTLHQLGQLPMCEWWIRKKRLVKYLGKYRTHLWLIRKRLSYIQVNTIYIYNCCQYMLTFTSHYIASAQWNHLFCILCIPEHPVFPYIHIILCYNLFHVIIARKTFRTPILYVHSFQHVNNQKQEQHKTEITQNLETKSILAPLLLDYCINLFAWE
jgi:hypothetical protein